MMFFGSVEDAKKMGSSTSWRRGSRQENGLPDESRSDDEMTGVNCGDSSDKATSSEQKQPGVLLTPEAPAAPLAPAFEPTSLSAPSTSGIVRDSNCIGMSDCNVTPEQIERCSRQKWGFNSAKVKNRDTTVLDAPAVHTSAHAQLNDVPKMETKTETTPDALFVSADRQPGLQIAKKYFINTLCDALNIDQSELSDRIRALALADAQNVILEAVTIKPRMTEPRILDPEEREFLLTKLIVELNISPNIASMFRRRTLSRNLFIAMTRHARAKDAPIGEKPTGARRVATGVEFLLPGVYTRRDVIATDKKIVPPLKDDGLIRVTAGDAPGSNLDEQLDAAIRARTEAFNQPRKWPTYKDIETLPCLDKCLEGIRVARRYPEFVDESDAYDHDIARDRVFRAEPATRDTVSKPRDFDFGSSIKDTIRRGLDSASRYCVPLVNDWTHGVRRGTVSPIFPEAADVSLNTFAKQVGSALRVLPFPPKEITFSMTLKA